VRCRLIRCKSNLETERVKKFEQRQEQSFSCELKEEINIVFGTGVNIRRRGLICDTLTRKEREKVTEKGDIKKDITNIE
jgi:hypothetical protein